MSTFDSLTHPERVLHALRLRNGNDTTFWALRRLPPTRPLLAGSLSNALDRLVKRGLVSRRVLSPRRYTYRIATTGSWRVRAGRKRMAQLTHAERVEMGRRGAAKRWRVARANTLPAPPPPLCDGCNAVTKTARRLHQYIKTWT